MASIEIPIMTLPASLAIPRLIARHRSTGLPRPEQSDFGLYRTAATATPTQTAEEASAMVEHVMVLKLDPHKPTSSTACPTPTATASTPCWPTGSWPAGSRSTCRGLLDAAQRLSRCP
jgi:hypothetical protein